MTTYVIQGRYTDQAMKGFLAKPEDRSALVKSVIEAAGAKFVAYYFTFGEYDFLIIAECDSQQDMVAILLTAAAGGAITGLKTTVAISGDEARQAMTRAKDFAGNYRPPGN